MRRYFIQFLFVSPHLAESYGSSTLSFVEGIAVGVGAATITPTPAAWACGILRSCMTAYLWHIPGMVMQPSCTQIDFRYCFPIPVHLGVGLCSFADVVTSMQDSLQSNFDRLVMLYRSYMSLLSPADFSAVEEKT